MMSQVANEVCVDVAYVVRGFKNIADVCSRPKSREGGLVDAAAANKALDCLAKVTGAYLADNSQKNEGWLEYQEWADSTHKCNK